MVTLGFFKLVVLMTKFSGKLLGRTHHIPSVSSSKGLLQRNREMRPHEWWAWMSTEQEPVSMPDSRRGSSWLGTHKMKHLPISSISSSIVTSLLLLSPCIQPPHLRPYPSSPSSWWPSAALTRFARSAPAPG